MNDINKKARFIELRANGNSFSQIAEEISTSKTTLVKWAKEFEGEIVNLKQIEIEALLAGLIYHSDRGVQYASHSFQDLLRENELRCSMSRRGDCYDNAVVESFFGTLKNELVYLTRFETRAQAKQEIFEYIEVFIIASEFIHRLAMSARNSLRK